MKSPRSYHANKFNFHLVHWDSDLLSLLCLHNNGTFTDLVKQTELRSTKIKSSGLPTLVLTVVHNLQCQQDPNQVLWCWFGWKKLPFPSLSPILSPNRYRPRLPASCESTKQWRPTVAVFLWAVFLAVILGIS